MIGTLKLAGDNGFHLSNFQPLSGVASTYAVFGDPDDELK
jgi:hypothetical protein